MVERVGEPQALIEEDLGAFRIGGDGMMERAKVLEQGSDRRVALAVPPIVRKRTAKRKEAKGIEFLLEERRPYRSDAPRIKCYEVRFQFLPKTRRVYRRPISTFE